MTTNNENNINNNTGQINSSSPSLIDRLIRFCLVNKLFVLIVLTGGMLWGVMVAPFDWDLGGLPRDPVPVDAIPDIGENQQIVFTRWMGRSPQDVEDQISYPLTVALLGVPGIKTVRSYSSFGFSSIYIIFKENVDFYWSRSRIIEKLNSLSSDTLPQGVQPALGPDATALGQVYWYTLEGRDKDGNPTGGWDLHELRSIQDWKVRYSLLSAEGVAEVGSIGGFVQEYQIDVDPDAMRSFAVKLEEVVNSVRMSNIDVGARTIEVNKVEYVIRGRGFIKNLEDIENAVIKSVDGIPVRVGDVANVVLGPALRRGVLDKEGAEAVGGVVVVRYGDNPLATIKNIKAKISEIQPSLPRKTLADGTISQVTVVPFYDRSGLINETLGTLDTALQLEILVTIIVVILMVMHLRSSILIAGLLPVTVLFCFVGMKVFGVDANIVALSGIAIAIGTIVDMGIVISENILKHLEKADPNENRLEVIHRASCEVGSAVLTAVATTIIGFLPVFTMEGAEGKLFKPLAYTKTFALTASIIIALTILPPVAHMLFTFKFKGAWLRRIRDAVTVGVGVWIGYQYNIWFGSLIIAVGLFYLFSDLYPGSWSAWVMRFANFLAAAVVCVVLARHWEPLGAEKGLLTNFVLVAGLIGSLLLFFTFIQITYSYILHLCLKVKLLVVILPVIVIITGITAWQGFDTTFGWLPDSLKTNKYIGPYITKVEHQFPGFGKEFMPPLDEGSYLYMPTTMVHASIGEALDVLQKLDMAIYTVPEVDSVVGKLGRAETPLDPAPISMVETVINYKSEYITDKDGHRVSFLFDKQKNEFARDEYGELIPDPYGKPYRQWRPHIRKPDDIWNEIVKVAKLPGTTSAPKLQPIAARIVMLQSGMRAPMGVKIKGPDLQTIEKVGLDIEQMLKEVPSVMSEAVNAERIIGKPYLEINIDRTRIARYGIKVQNVQDVIESAIGGKLITTTVEGRERYPVRVRYLRELRDDIESLGSILIPAPSGAQIPLIELADIEYVRGPQVIKSEDTFLVSYVLFDKKSEFAEVDVVEAAKKYLQQQEDIFASAYLNASQQAEAQGRKLTEDEINKLPGLNRRDCSYTFAGSYENQIRSVKRMKIVLPLALAVIFLIIYFQFSSVCTSAIIFFGIFIAWGGGFLLIWAYGQSWFLNAEIFDTNLRDLFQVHPINMSVAVWVGFLALFGIASDDGVIVATYLKQTFERTKPNSINDIREATIIAGKRRIRPCLMTVATTILALLPVLTSTGRGSDIMVPMAIPTFGGMLVVLMTVFTVPTLYCAVEEFKYNYRQLSDKQK